MSEIDYEQLVANYTEMINTLEYDSMRSPGKAKLNAAVLASMLELKAHYQAKLNSKKAAAKKEAA